MCGIAGLIKSDGTHAAPEHVLGMIARMRHRGPDACGVERDGAAALGHARLSIIDLSGGAQPMRSADGNLCITFNGEIFNYVELRDDLLRAGHRFLTHSDTEVLLHLYQEHGEDCLGYLNGQWAFAVWDRTQRKLFAARDRVGVRPFFYTQTRDAFVFASEVKALFACPGVERAFNLGALDQIFTFWVALPPSSMFRGISELPPGHCLTWREGALTVRRYWQLDYTPEPQDGDRYTERKAEELLDLLRDAARIRLRADVPVGAYLSGGLDSTLTTALVRQVHTGDLRTFSVAFADTEYDESAYQREASAFLGTQHQEVRCTYDDIATVFPKVVWHAETPILRTAPAPLFLLSKLVRDSNFKVIVTGEGADEMFGGYDIFKEAKIRRFWAAIPDSRLRPLLLKRLYPYMKQLQKQSPAYLSSFFHVGGNHGSGPFFSHIPRWEMTSRTKLFFSSEVKSALGNGDVYAGLEHELPAKFASWPAFCQAQYLESAYLLPGYILSSQGDRMAMAHSVEGRYPFLDYRVVEFAAKLPPSIKMKVLNEKYILKLAARGLIPDAVLRRSKQPYRAPDGRSFFADGAKAYVADVLSPDSLRRDGIFDPAAVSHLLQKFRSGTALGVKDDMALVGILSTQLVAEQFIHHNGEPS